MLYGQAFRAPNYYESTYTSPGQSSDNSLVPEKIATTELVMEQSLGSHSRLVTSLFHYDLNQVITQVTDSAGNLQYVNLAGVASEGIETELQTRMINGIDGYVGFTLERTRDAVTNQRISNSPDYLVTAGVSVPIGKRYFISPDLQLVGSTLTPSGNEIGAAMVCNLTVTTKNPKGLGISLGLYNMFNTTVYAPGEGQTVEDEIPHTAGCSASKHPTASEAPDQLIAPRRSSAVIGMPLSISSRA